ncbi:quinol dehydrogenase membrane component [Edwardsiella tarda]|nr:quinol dehydrogenase membrane component [Edwardsiella tarda]
MANPVAQAGQEARRRLGWWRSQRWLWLRRSCQLGVLALFLSGPVFGYGS